MVLGWASGEKKVLRIRQPLLQTARPSKGNNFVCLSVSVSLALCGLQIFICSVRLAQIKEKKSIFFICFSSFLLLNTLQAFFLPGL